MHGFFYQCLHMFNFIFVGLCLESPFPHRVGTQCRVTNIACIVDTLWQIVDGIQKLREGFPGPVDTFQHRITGQIFGAFQVTEYQVSILLFTRRQGKAAVAHHHTGDAVIAGAGTDGVPENLGVHMGMAVDKAGRNHMTFCINGLFGFFVNAANLRDLTVCNRNVGAIPGTA